MTHREGASSQIPESLFRIAVVGDLHYPGNHPEAKRAALRDLNARSDLDLIVFIGDLCHFTGSPEEYRDAGEALAELERPFILIPGNHDFWFADAGILSMAWGPSSPEMRQTKLDRFRQLAKRDALYFSREAAGYFLIFLALDDPNGQFYGSITEEQRTWLASELASHAGLPTIIFCHAPVAPPELVTIIPAACNYVVQPLSPMVNLMARHPQVLLWVSGHVHFAPEMPWVGGHESRLRQGLTVLHLCDLDGDSVFTTDLSTCSHRTLWTTTLELAPQMVTARVFNHTTQVWEDRFQRRFPVPAR